MQVSGLFAYIFWQEALVWFLLNQQKDQALSTAMASIKVHLFNAAFISETINY